MYICIYGVSLRSSVHDRYPNFLAENWDIRCTQRPNFLTFHHYMTRMVDSCISDIRFVITTNSTRLFYGLVSQHWITAMPHILICRPKIRKLGNQQTLPTDRNTFLSGTLSVIMQACVEDIISSHESVAIPCQWHFIHRYLVCRKEDIPGSAVHVLDSTCHFGSWCQHKSIGWQFGD